MNFLSDQMRRNPFPAYARMRQTMPVFHDPQTNLWMIFDYDGVKRALQNSAEFSSDLKASANQPTPPWMIFTDPPRHTQLRALIMRAFTPRMIASLEPRIRELSQNLLDSLAGREAFDLAAEFSVPLPLMVIAEMIGIPAAEWPRFRRWSEIILLLSYTAFDSAALAKVNVDYFATAAEMKDFLHDLIEQRKAAPADDLLSSLVHAEVEGQRLSEEEILAFVQLLLVAGNETTTNLLNNAVLCFLDHPDQLARLRAAPDLLPSAIEEVLRFRAPLQFMYRATRRDVEMNGQRIPTGRLVLAVIGSANRDPSQFDDADCFDISRDPNPHVAFGHGIHFCLGAALSRLETRIALSALLARFERLERASEEPWQPRQALHVHGPASLLLRAQTARTAAVV